MRLLNLTNELLAWRCWRYRKLLWLAVDGASNAQTQSRFQAHLPQCARCQAEFEELRFAREQVSRLQLPGEVPIEFPLWLKEQASGQVIKHNSWNWPRWAVPATVTVLLLAGVLIWYSRWPDSAGWEVTRLAGVPTIGKEAISKHGNIEAGEWLETNRESRALIRVGNIGHVEIEPDSRVRLLATQEDNHRLSLARGRMHASIFAPPKLFFIETPSAVAIDYGCAYTLEVDESGASLLQVTAGWVSLKALEQTSRQAGGRFPDRESLVPAGAMCRALPEKGPGTPFFSDASEKFRQTLHRFDFEDDGGEALTVLLTEARKRDSLTLFHLLPRVTEAERARVYEGLSAFVLPPAGLTQANLLQPENAEKLDAWREQVEFVSVGGNPADLPKTTGTLRLTGTLNVARHSHSATLLADGRVLVAGGVEQDEGALDSSEIYDPKTG